MLSSFWLLSSIMIGYIWKKTPKTADEEIDWDLVSDVTIYIRHNTWREIFATRNKIRRTVSGTNLEPRKMNIVKIL